MTIKIFTFFDQNPKTHQVSWFKEVKADLASIGISEEYIRNRTIFKNKVKEFKDLRSTHEDGADQFGAKKEESNIGRE